MPTQYCIVCGNKINWWDMLLAPGLDSDFKIKCLHCGNRLTFSPFSAFLSVVMCLSLFVWVLSSRLPLLLELSIVIFFIFIFQDLLLRWFNVFFSLFFPLILFEGDDLESKTKDSANKLIMSNQRCTSCMNKITWQDMLKPTLSNYYVNFRIVKCPHCEKTLVFNK